MATAAFGLAVAIYPSALMMVHRASEWLLHGLP
jgi:hypothetical protein